ncbi:response regulator [Ornithinimicrobium sufpigmenti]|uniref:response regulator n=1 Tax=Ornithinimicrobium sufpigmenti TaxID=2508882 RepID=UPI0010357502|nr:MULTISPECIES: response regulator [unclassified Ornithinimicrobium]
MTSPAAASPAVGTPSRSISVLLYSNDRAVRDHVRLAVGTRPADDVTVSSWTECATPDAVLMEVQGGDFDVLILDGEARPYGGMGLCRQLKSEIFQCPPVLVLTGRPGDGWLATWSLADAFLSRPLDESRLCAAVAELARR